MFQHPSDDRRSAFLRTLATNKGAFNGYLEYLREEVETQQRLLESAAVAALLDIAKRDIAQVQLGKVEMAKAMLADAERCVK